mmetsp:Transcript_37301/g.90575  ORF Transcript_37301/g.90575 Transcript_37301/m.90575 type:complete len:189 (+) Transcript_37301:261-827(+)
MLAIIPPECDIYSRLWCVYEIFVAMKLGVPVLLEAFVHFNGQLGADRYDNALAETATEPVRTEFSRCGYKPDADMIKKEIEKEGGFHVIDDAVMWVRINSLVKQHGETKNDDYRNISPLGECTLTGRISDLNITIAESIEVWEREKASRASEKSLGDVKEEATSSWFKETVISPTSQLFARCGGMGTE